jgi:hypothetical protein
MKVRELVEMLVKLDQDKEVYCIEAKQGDWGIKPVTEIEDHGVLSFPLKMIEEGYLIS